MKIIPSVDINPIVFRDEFVKVLSDLSKRYSFFSFSTPRRSMSNAEMFFITHAISQFQPEQVFESGVYKGRSTLIIAEVLARFSPKTKYSVACLGREPEVEEIIRDYPSIVFRSKPGESAVRKLDKLLSTIMVIDGPKARSESPIIYKEALNFPSLIGLFQHDVSRKLDRRIFRSYYKKHYSKNFTLQFLYKPIVDIPDESDNTIPNNLGMYFTKYTQNKGFPCNCIDVKTEENF